MPSNIADDFLANAYDRKRLYELLMRVPAAVSIVSASELRVEFANPLLRKLFRASRVVIGKTVHEAFPEIEPSLINTMKQVAQSGKGFRGNELAVRLDWEGNGQPYDRYFDLTFESLPDADGKPGSILTFAYEITGQVQARQQIAKREEEYSTLFNTIDQGFCIIEIMFDRAGKKAVDYRFLKVNRLFEEQTGLKSAKGRTARELMPDLEGEWFEIYGQVALTGIARRFESGSGGMGRWFDIYASRIGGQGSRRVALLLTDITERRRTQSALRASEQRFRFMAESMPQKIFTVSPEGEINYFNPQWSDYTGLSIPELLRGGLTRSGTIHPDDRAKVRKVWRTSLATGTPAEYEFRMRRQDGMFRWHIGRVNPMHDTDGGIRMWIGSVTDIEDSRRTAQRRHELEIETATLAEQRAQLLALNQAKDEFISLASHQLRTPATGVKQYLGMLLEGYAGELSKDQAAFLETAYESNERQINIVNDLLQVARIDAGKVTLRRHSTDLLKLVKNVVNEHASRFVQRDQKVILRSKDNKVPVSIDSDRIRMVLDNIIDNASKYTTDGKRITITVQTKPGKVVVSIADQGVGMEESDLGRIFQKFSRLENPRTKSVEGSGLGLYWAKKIVDLHNGSIKVKSIAAKGTTVTVSLPIPKKS